MTTSVTTRAAGTRNPTRQQLDELDALLQRMLELPVHPLEEPELAEPEEAAEELLPPPAVNLGEQPASAGWSSPHHPADAGHSPPQPTLRPVSPPVSYMVVETASPRPLPPASGFEPRPSALTPRGTPATPAVETPVPPRQTVETPATTPICEPDDEETWVPLRSTWQPSAQTWPPLAESWHQFNGGASSANRQRPLPAATPEEDTSESAADEKDSPVSQTPAEDTDNRTASAAASPSAPAIVPRLRLSAEDAPVAVPWPLQPLLWFNQGFDACLAPLGSSGDWLCGPGRHLLGFIGLACLAAAVILGVLTGMGWTW
jgi:hypothetical protein